jgi:2'-hydroxyisoflavone reductase
MKQRRIPTMNILIIGGTRFLGRHLVESALGRGHQLTLFNRGQTNPGIFPGIETVFGDRETDLGKLIGREWNAVIDTCGYFPRLVKLSTNMLKDSVKQYVFISSVSAYADFETIRIDENYALGTIEDETVEEITGETYGPLKALCEKAVRGVFPDGALIIRSGLIVGPHDPTDRFTYWPVRVARGGKVLAPVGPDEPVQFIYVRDLAEFTIKCIEEETTGVFNVVGPGEPCSFGELLETCKQVSGSDAAFVWASEEFIAENEVAPWTELPLWVPESEGRGFSRVSNERAQAAGLMFRSTEEIVRDTLEWAKSRPADYEMRAGLKPEREAELLKKLEEV